MRGKMQNKPTINRVVVGAMFLGLVLVTTGAALIYHPLGFIVAGVELIAFATLAARRA
jgi:hypothetical protein